MKGRVIRALLVAGVAVTVSGCASMFEIQPPQNPPPRLREISSSGATGYVIDQATGYALPGALVWARWEVTLSGFHSSSWICLYMDMAVTDAQGRFAIQPWRIENPPYPFEPRKPIMEVYLPGYGRSTAERGVMSNPNLYVSPFPGTADERFKFLTTLYHQASCEERNGTDTRFQVAKVQRAIIAEAERIPGAEQKGSPATPGGVLSLLRGMTAKLDGLRDQGPPTSVDSTATRSTVRLGAGTDAGSISNSYVKPPPTPPSPRSEPSASPTAPP